MFYISDLHVHSHYAAATSKNLNLETLYQWASIKGIHIIGTGDFTHPAWFNELKEKLLPDGNGLFKLKNCPSEPALPGMKIKDIDVRFCLSTEICSDYEFDHIRRKNHNLVYAPDFDTAARINARLSRLTDLALDGRPTLKLSSRDMLEIVLQSSDHAFLIPAHAWTPWFSTLGSKAGYDSVDACFRDLTHHIFALETGLSSDPAMNWKCSALDKLSMMSNSDAHSPQNIGREANRFDTEFSYYAMFNALQTGNGFEGTYEFFPEEGKYYYDGHRDCAISLEPAATSRLKGICPNCGKPLTIGVLHRVEKLADRSIPLQPARAPGFKHIIPLPEILAEINGTSTNSKKVWATFSQLISIFGNEFTLLNETPIEDIQRKANPQLAEAIHRMREGKITISPGYDGKYGEIKIFGEGELNNYTRQLHFF